MNNMKMLTSIFAALLVSVAHADDIEFPDEELARESVLPVFEKPQSVLNRSITMQKRLELGVGMGLEMNEPYYSDYTMNIQGTYHLDEHQAFNLLGIMWMDGLSSYGEQLKNGGSGGSSFVPFDATLAPHPKWSLIGNYEFVAYYGKISLSKQSVMHLNLFGVAGLGYLNMDSINTFILNLGIGQNFYFTKNFALRFDLRCLIFRGPNPASQKLEPGVNNPSAGDFSQRIFFNTQLGLTGIIVL